MNALKQKWKEFISWLVENSEYRDFHIEQCEIKFITYYGTARRHDIDNGCPKFIIDGLCENGFIIDDDSKHITSLTMQCFVDTENPRTEIEVYVSKLLTDYKRPELKEEKPMATKKNKEKRISVSTMDSIMKNIDDIKIVKWNEIDVTVKTHLSMDDMLNFVDSVVQSCFDAKTEEYRPDAKDFAVRANIMTRYANFTLPDRNVDHQYDIVMRSGAPDMILDYIDMRQFNEMMCAINEKISHRASASIHILTKKFDDVVTAFQKLQYNIEQQFDGINNDEIAALVKAVSNGTLSEEAIVKAYLEQKALA